MLDFLGIGAQKSGTTWLYEHLRRHPDIEFPAGKEVHFWNLKRANGIDWYRSLFEREGLDGKKCGEITPAYAILTPEFIEECHANFPDLKIIYIIRNPIERAWSSAKMALARAEMRMEEASDQWFIDHFRSRGSMMRGDYEACLRNWFAYYSESQWLVCLHDDLEHQPRQLLRRCCEFIGAEAAGFFSTDDLARKIFASFEAPLPDRLRTELQRIYLPKIASLADFLDMDLSGWA